MGRNAQAFDRKAEQACQLCFRTRAFPSKFCEEHRKERGNEARAAQGVAVELMKADLRRDAQAIREQWDYERELLAEAAKTADREREQARERAAKSPPVQPIQIEPALGVKDPQTGISMRFVREYDVAADKTPPGLAFDPRAFQFVMRDLPLPTTGPVKAAALEIGKPRRYSDD